MRDEILVKLERLNMNLVNEANKEFNVDHLANVVEQPPVAVDAPKSRIIRIKKPTCKRHGVRHAKNPKDIKTSEKVNGDKITATIVKHECCSKDEPRCSQTTNCKQDPSGDKENFNPSLRESDSLKPCNSNNLKVEEKVEKAKAEEQKPEGDKPKSASSRRRHRRRGGAGRSGGCGGCGNPSGRNGGRSSPRFVAQRYDYSFLNRPSRYTNKELAWGFTQSEVDDLLAQNVKPWEDDAVDVLAFLRGGCQEYYF
uniref:Uncharacterized protein n=1 Tax=Trichobilharzia regenti TaxID=157069 RepID=A0AA85K3R0_TRIRE|nr:unnamed protein product [Trichobilharzia regenti]